MVSRLHGLDFCRAIFMLLGLFYHVGLIYGVDANWSVGSVQRSAFIAEISVFIHGFRMQAFYIISGFFYILVYEKRRTGFLSDRLSRSVLPMITCGILINPIMFSFSDNGALELSWSTIWSGKWLAHLWFLGNLTVYFLIFFPLIPLFYKFSNLSVHKLLIYILLVIPFLSIVGVLISKFTISERLLFISFSNLWYYACYFLLGCLCYINREKFISLLKFKVFIISLILFFTAKKFLGYIFEDPSQYYVASYILTGLVVLSMTAITFIIGNRQNKLIKALSDSSYTVYLLHQPLIIIIYSLWLDDVALGVWNEYMLLIVTTFVVSVMVHFYIVEKNKYIKLIFNGVPLKKN